MRVSAYSLVIGLIILTGSACSIRDRGGPVTISQALQLSSAEVRKGGTVEIEAVLTFVDKDENALYCQDRTGAILVNALTSLASRPLGGMIRVRGALVENGSGQRSIDRATVREVLDTPEAIVKELIKPVPAAPDDFLRLAGRLVEVRGVLLNAEYGENFQLRFEIESQGKLVEVESLSPYGFQLKGELNREVTLRGIAAPVVGMDEKIEKYLLRSWQGSDLALVQGVVASEPRRVSIEEAQRMARDGVLSRVTVEGEIKHSAALGQLTIGDETGALPVFAAVGSQAGLGRFRVTALPGQRNEQLVLAGATFEKLPGRNGVEDPPQPVMRTLREVRQLPGYLADLRRPVDVDCILTFVNSNGTLNFCEDASAGIYVSTTGNQNRAFKAGDKVRIRGVSGAGGFAPEIDYAQIEYRGHPGLRVAPPPDRDALLTGKDDSQWRRISGLVLSAERDPTYLHLNLLVQGRLIHVYSMDDAADPNALIGRHAEISGALGTLINNRRQLVGYRLFSPPGAIRVLAEKSGVASSPTLSHIREVGNLSLNRSEETPYRIQAVVTLLQPPNKAYVADATGGILIQANGEVKAALGDRVEVVGYVGRGSFSPFLNFATVRVLGAGNPVVPPRVSARQAVQGFFDSRLISLEGVLLQEIRNFQDLQWIVQSGSITFVAQLEAQAGSIQVEPGSKIRLTGVAVNRGIVRVTRLVSEGFELRLRTAADLEVLRLPSWWASERVQFLLVLIVALVAAGLCWVHLLRRQVRRQTSIIESQLEKEASLRRKANEANQAKSRFLATMSHEIRTPLNGILGFARLAHEDCNDPQQQEKLGIIRRSGEALLAIINDILDFSKIEADRMTIETAPMQPAELVRTSCSLFGEMAKSKDLKLVCAVDSETPDTVLGDAVRLRQILMNLIGNAIKFTNSGSVQVSAALIERNGIRCLLRFMVEDTGCGIPNDKLGDIFEAFQQADTSITRRFGGTGLGLAISRKLARLMGGDILVQSTLGVGSRFQVELWLDEAAPAKHIPNFAPANAERVSGSSYRVLVAEDNRTNQVLIQHLLERAGHRVELVGNGSEAIDAAVSSQFDVILLDIEMPVMDGLQALKELRKRNTEPPIVALTAYSMEEDRKRMADAGFDGYVTKPINYPTLEAEMHRVVADRKLAPLAAPPLSS